MLIANTDGFDPKNLRLAGISDGKSPLEDGSLEGYHVIQIDVTKMTRAALAESGLGTKEIDRAKNMFVLGFLYWMYNRTLDHTIKFLDEKFGKKPDIHSANVKVLKAGYHFGDTREDFTTRFTVGPARMAIPSAARRPSIAHGGRAWSHGIRPNGMNSAISTIVQNRSAEDAAPVQASTAKPAGISTKQKS
jgi:2-oxoglutarate ferredoxin oxidoreductase subunit alpha